MRVAILALLLTACMSPEENARRMALQNEGAQAAYGEQLRTSCESIGYQRDTEPWRQCIMQLHAQNQASSAALGAALLQGAASRPGVIPCRSLPPGTAGLAYSRGQCY